MTARARLDAILADTSLDDGASDTSRVEVVEALIAEAGWPAVDAALRDVLRHDGDVDHHEVVAAVYFGAACDGRSVDVDEVIALLLWRLWPDGAPEHNLVWSVVCKLKGVEYMSSYSPHADPAVRAELAKLVD